MLFNDRPYIVHTWHLPQSSEILDPEAGPQLKKPPDPSKISIQRNSLIRNDISLILRQNWSIGGTTLPVGQAWWWKILLKLSCVHPVHRTAPMYCTTCPMYDCAPSVTVRSTLSEQGEVISTVENIENGKMIIAELTPVKVIPDLLPVKVAE